MEGIDGPVQCRAPRARRTNRESPPATERLRVGWKRLPWHRRSRLCPVGLRGSRKSSILARNLHRRTQSRRLVTPGLGKKPPLKSLLLIGYHLILISCAGVANGFPNQSVCDLFRGI